MITSFTEDIIGGGYEESIEIKHFIKKYAISSSMFYPLVYYLYSKL